MLIPLFKHLTLNWIENNYFWNLNLDPQPESLTCNLKKLDLENLNPKKPGPWKTLIQKNLDPEKPGL